MIFELVLKDTAFNFAQLAATCPRVTENSVDINGIPQEGARVDVAWMDVLIPVLFGKYSC